jgi:hypothetical protein
MKSVLIIVILVIIVVLGFVLFSTREGVETPPETPINGDLMPSSPDGDKLPTKEQLTRDFLALPADSFMYQGELLDVADSGASGFAEAGIIESTYRLRATFNNLLDPQGTDFYEGWVVRRAPLDIISTRRVEKIDANYVNVFASPTNLTDHDFYVLTIEPDDGDPAPADHVVEGVLMEK